VGSADPGLLALDQPQRPGLVVVPGVQVHRAVVAVYLAQPHHPHEEVPRLLQYRREQLDRADVGDVPAEVGVVGDAGLWGGTHPVAFPLRGQTRPSDNLRAVRSTALRRSRVCGPSPLNSTDTSKVPLGCSTRTSRPSVPARNATVPDAHTP